MTPSAPPSTSVADEVIATIPELPREIEMAAGAEVRTGSWPDDAYRGWSGLYSPRRRAIAPSSARASAGGAACGSRSRNARTSTSGTGAAGSCIASS